MAIEILIRLTNGTGGRTAGDIIALRSYPHQGWGAGEGLPNYAVVRLTSLSVAQFSQYHKRHYRDQQGSDIYGARSQYRIDLPSLPANIRNALTNSGFYEGTTGTAIVGAVTENNLVLIRPAE